MNYTEFLEIYKKLEDYFNRHDDTIVMVYYKTFKDTKKETFNKIVQIAIEQCEFFPKIATLKEIKEQLKKEEYKPVHCEKCNGSGMLPYTKIVESYQYEYVVKCDCQNGKRLSKYIPTAAEVGLSKV